MKIILLVVILASLVALGSTKLDSFMSFSKLKCKIVQDNNVNCSDVTGRSCDDSKYLEVVILINLFYFILKVNVIIIRYFD
jgi:hypothetical protein